MFPTKDKQTPRIDPKRLSALIFSKVLYKTRFCKRKGNEALFCIDLLKEDVKTQLLSTATLKTEEIYTCLIEKHRHYPFYFSKIEGKEIFFLLLQKTCEAFLTSEYGYQVNIDLKALKKSFYTKELLNNTEILFRVPFYTLLDQKSPLFRSIYYPVYSSASEDFVEVLIHNLVLEISNCVTYYVIMDFSSIYAFRQQLYKSKFLSLRNFERFKNNIEWKLRISASIEHPLDLYNNRSKIYLLRTSGIHCKKVYANRSKEVVNLERLPLLAIVLIEIWDFIMSRVDEIFYITSRVLRFTFTSFLGQVIGLVWQGIIKGLKK